MARRPKTQVKEVRSRPETWGRRLKESFLDTWWNLDEVGFNARLQKHKGVGFQMIKDLKETKPSTFAALADATFSPPLRLSGLEGVVTDEITARQEIITRLQKKQPKNFKALVERQQARILNLRNKLG